MAFTTADLQKLERAIASGTKRVIYRDRTVEYQSLADMIDARSQMAQELGIDLRAAAPKRRRLFRVAVRSGY